MFGGGLGVSTHPQEWVLTPQMGARPSPLDRQTPVKTLPSRKLRLQAITIRDIIVHFLIYKTCSNNTEDLICKT